MNGDVPQDHNKRCERVPLKNIKRCKCKCGGRYHGLAHNSKIFQFSEGK